MKRTWQSIRDCAILIALSCSGLVWADNFAIDWWTVDGGGAGGAGPSTGGGFELGGSIGQPDAGVMTGGEFELTGGFWSVPPCWCLSDVNNDGLRNGLDVQDFVNCLLASGFNCACGDLETNGTLDLADAAVFVADLLDGASCP